MNKTKLLCIYHGNCADGFGAAWAVRERCRRSGIPVEFYAATHGDPPPDVTKRHVLIVDFSYKRAVLLEMGAVAKSIVILDHHKSAAEDLAGFREPAPFSQWEHSELPLVAGDEIPVAALFDMARSGAGLTWDFFFEGASRPRLISHIEDRDLWKFEIPGTREIQAALFSYPYDFETWDRLMSTDAVERLREEGAVLERKHHKDVRELVGVCKRRVVIAGQEVWAASLPYTLTSDAGHLMAEGEPFAACYWDTPEGRVFSLRSRPEGADVSEIAKQYGGGGHKNASGFRVPLDQIGQFEVTA